MSAPLFELALPADQDPVADAELAFAGAAFHLGKLEGLVATRATDIATLNQIHWHFRGFFWELHAIRDCLQKADGPGHADLRQYEESTSAESWNEQVRAYRNHLHQSFYVLEAVTVDDEMNGLHLQPLTSISPAAGPAPAGDSLGLLNWYLDSARRFLDAAPRSHGRQTRRR